MSLDIPELRSSVISDSTRVSLDEYRGFRHIVRNVYTFNFSPDKVSKLVVGGPSLFAQVQTELLAFVEFLEEQL